MAPETAVGPDTTEQGEPQTMPPKPALDGGENASRTETNDAHEGQSQAEAETYGTLVTDPAAIEAAGAIGTIGTSQAGAQGAPPLPEAGLAEAQERLDAERARQDSIAAAGRAAQDLDLKAFNTGGNRRIAIMAPWPKSTVISVDLFTARAVDAIRRVGDTVQFRLFNGEADYNIKASRGFGETEHHLLELQDGVDHVFHEPKDLPALEDVVEPDEPRRGRAEVVDGQIVRS